VVHLLDITKERQAELSQGELTRPPAHFLEDVEAYMRSMIAHAGRAGHAVFEPEDEVFAAVALLEEYFETRRDKITLLARDGVMPPRGAMFPMEETAFAALEAAHQALQEATVAVIRPR
jgi:hypothetical protein